ncbi:hypothetical protein ACS0TY_025536 [Phlomoides rotata]
MSSSTADVVKAKDSPDIQAVINDCFMSVSRKNDDPKVVLKKAFQTLSGGHEFARVSADVLVRAMEYVGPELTPKEVNETIRHVTKKQEQINCDEFIKIAQLLLKPSVVASRILGKPDVENIVLYGKSGVGKSWMAQKIAGHATRKGGFDVAIWVYLNRIYEGLSLHESIAYQLSVLTDFEKSETRRKQELEKNGIRESEEAKRDRIEEVIRAELKKKKKKNLLLVVDGQSEGSKMKLNWSQEKDGKKKLHLMVDGQSDINLGAILGLDVQSHKVLITSTNQPADSEGTIGLVVRPLTWDESRSLVSQQIMIKPDEIKELAEFFISKSERLPSEILLLARVVSSFGRSDPGMKKLREDKEILEKVEGSKLGDVLIRGYEGLPKSVLIDCYSSETSDRHFLRRGGMVNFNDLIGYWIIEEHLGHFDRIEDAYEEGHRVLMELMNCGLLQKQEGVLVEVMHNGLLQKQEGDYVTPSGARFNFDIHDRNDFYRKIHRGLGVTYDMKLGRVAWTNGMIKTVSSSGQEVQKPLTLFLDGNYIGEKSPAETLFMSSSELEKLPPADSLLESLTELENLAVFSPTGQHFQRPVGMKKLRLLVLRGCQYLNSLDPYFELTKDENNPPKLLRRAKSSPLPSEIQSHSYNPPLGPLVPHNLETLTVLEISGPSLLSKIPESLFEKMSNLKTLNMSHLPIMELPPQFYNLTKIEFLILRGCPSFQELKTLTKFKGLQTIDLSGSTSFEKFHDKSLRVNDKLQILNLSGTKIKTIPLVNSNPLLKFISLKDCTALQRIRQISKLKNLQIFDMSGATQVEEFRDPSLEKLTSLVILDVSRTAIRRLPANVCNPRYLYVQGCPHLKRLPPVEGFTKAEVIDLSGSSNLEEIRKEFFSNMNCLRELNLSKTSVKHLPFLSSLGCLRRLLLVECQHLEKLEKLSALEELEFLDLSGCKDLMEIDDDSFDRMNRLQYLNLSGIKLGRLPSLSKLMKLEELYVRDCPNIKELRGIEGLPVLDRLDYSGTTLKPRPSFSNPDRKRRVLGVDIDNIDHQEMLNKLGARPDMNESTDQQKVDFTQDDLRPCKWSISAVVDKKLCSSVHGSHFLQLLMKHPSLLSKKLSRFHFLVQPTTEKVALLEADGALYTSEVTLRDIYFEQVSQEKMERCLEIREFYNVPPFLGYLLKQAQFVVLIDNAFLKSLLDLGADNIMVMKACWIERCDQLEHVIVSKKEEDTEKPEESTKSRGDQPEEQAKSKGDQTGALAKNEGKPGEPAKSKGDQPGEPANSQGEPEEPASSQDEAVVSAKSKDEPGEPANSQGEPGKSAKSKDETGEPASSQDEAVELAKRKDEPRELAKSKGDQPGEPASSQDEAVVSAKSKDEPGEPANSQGEPGKSAKSKDETGEPASSQDEAVELAKRKDEPRELAKSKGDQPGEPASSQDEAVVSAKSKDEPVEPAKSEGEAEKSKDEPGEPANSQGEPGKSAKSKDETGEPASSQDEAVELAKRKDEPVEPAIRKDEPGESAKSKGEPRELAKSKGDTEKNIAYILEKFEILWISDGLNLRSIVNRDISFKNLKSLYLEYCPQMSIICSSSLQLQSLEILYVKYCQKLETLFTDDTAQLKKLTELHLWGLEELKGIDYVPSLRILRVGECPLLKHIINASTQGCDHQEFEGHGNLEILHIKSCDKVKTICESSEEDAPYFPKLQELEVSGLPELKKIACAAAPSLQHLRVSECSSLQHIVGNSDTLSIVEVKYCDELKTIFRDGGLDLRKVEKMELLSLPELNNVNGGELPPSLTEECMIWGCPKLLETDTSGRVSDP